MAYLKINKRRVKLTSLEKPLWPEDNLTKYDLIHYFTEAAPFLLPHLKNRLLVVQRFPEGISREGFYQKNCPEGAPEWISTFTFAHRENKITSYIIANNIETLIWLGNQSAVELHPWLSSTERLDCPDYAVFDLDPTDVSTFNWVKETAVVVRGVLNEIGLDCYPKTSGATGLQLYVPLEPVYTYREVRNFTEKVCRKVNKVIPHITTIERKVERRQGKVYLDYLQNVQGKTIASVYSPRPLDGAPVSAPVSWEELKKPNLAPSDFKIKNMLSRLKSRGDMFEEVLRKKQKIPSRLMELMVL